MANLNPNPKQQLLYNNAILIIMTREDDFFFFFFFLLRQLIIITLPIMAEGPGLASPAPHVLDAAAQVGRVLELRLSRGACSISHEDFLSAHSMRHCRIFVMFRGWWPRHHKTGTTYGRKQKAETAKR